MIINGNAHNRAGEVQERQKPDFTSNMLGFLFKSNLIFTNTGSLGAPNATVQFEHARILILIGFNFYQYGQFRSLSGGSLGAANAEVHLKHAIFFI
jgi:hypothetical protein